MIRGRKTFRFLMTDKTVKGALQSESKALWKSLKYRVAIFSEFLRSKYSEVIDAVNYFPYLENRILNKSYYQVCKRDKQDIREINLQVN